MSSPETLEEAEVVVVGGGPAGSVAAAELAERGHDVVIVDQSGFPREKPCGDGLTHAAVEFLEQRGFGELLEKCQPIEDVRVVVGHEQVVDGWYRPPAAPRYARTLRRFDLDNALFERAQGAGARFLQARVDAPEFEGETAAGVTLAGGEGRVAARCVVAADGATSRIRRTSGIPAPRPGSQVYALRYYADSAQPLDPVFDVYVPLLYEGGLLAGYGWVFPVSEHRANIGVAYYEPPPGRPRARIREVLKAFSAGLEQQSGERFGGFANPTEPIGAPISTQFLPDRCEVGNVIFAGEAARAADPLSGEGISFALQSGEFAAEEASRLLRGEARHGQGKLIAGHYTRLGQDLTLPARLAAAAATGVVLNDRNHQPWMLRARRVTSFAPDPPSVDGTDVREALAGADPDCARALDAAADRVRESLQTSFPLALEVLHRELRSDGGPVAAATALAAARAGGGGLDGEALAAAAGCELLLLGAPCLLEVSAETSSEMARLNNALAMLSGRFALARAQESALRGPPGFAAAIAAAARAGIESTASGLGLTAEALELAAGAGSNGASGQLGEAGRELGSAWQIGTEIRDLTVGDDVAGRAPGGDLLARRPTLPLRYAAEDDELAERIEGKLGGGAARELLAAIRACGALERAASEASAHADRAEQLIAAARPARPDALLALVALARERLAPAAATAAS